MPNPVLSSLTLPVMNAATHEVESKTFDLPAGGGGSVTVDDALSSTSENALQNKVINAALEGKANSSSLSSVATSGSYNDLSDKPTIPTQTSQLTNNSGYVGFTDLTTSVAKGATSASFTNAAITSSKNYEVFSTVFTQITGMSISNTTLTVTFKAAAAAMTMKLRIS